MKRITIGLLVLLTFCIIVDRTSASDRVYVTDSLNITLRTGPSIENKILLSLSSGQLLDLMETEGNWCRVKVIEDDEVKMEGWVLKQYLTDRIPAKIQVETLMNENKDLKEKLSTVNDQFNEVQKEQEDLSSLYQNGQEDLKKLKGEFDSLKNASSNFLKLREEHDMAQAKIKSLTERAEKLDSENASLRRSQRNIWFATGALVLLCGLLIGFIVGRQSTKRRTSYY
ncbi:MAG: TIGR04211 family SH3 domain-containing protein [Candidatus Hodarchaeota archaeon]